MCLYTNPSELCNHSECLRYYLSQGSNIQNSNLITAIGSLIEQQSIALNDLVNKNSILNQHLDRLSVIVNQVQPVQTIITEEQFNIEGIFR